MPTAAVGVAQPEDGAEGMPPQDIFDGVVRLLPAITPRLGRRVLGADAAPGRPVRGPRGEAGAGTGTAPPGAAAAAETPSRGAKAGGRGASPRGRSTPQRGPEHVEPAGRLTLPPAAQTSLHPLEGRGLEVHEQDKQASFRRGQGAVQVHGELAGRPGGGPARRHAAIGA